MNRICLGHKQLRSKSRSMPLVVPAFASLLSILLLAGTSQAIAQDAKSTVKVVGVRVAAEIPGDEMQTLSVFNGQTGTALAVLVKLPAGGLIAFDKEASKLDVFGDDAGTDLLGGEDSMFGPFGSFPRIAEDTKAAMLELSAPGVPAAGAKALRAKGVLKFTHATKTKTIKAENVALKAESQFEAGPMKFEIAAADKPEWGDAKLEITLNTKQNTDAIRAIRFFDADGAEIESEDSGGGYMGFGGDITYHLVYGLGKKVEQATIEIEMWEDLKTLDIPFDLTAGVGLSK